MRCAFVKKYKCRASAVLPSNGDVSKFVLRRPHNHPPDANAEEKEIFIRELKTAVRNMDCSTKEVYKTLALL